MSRTRAWRASAGTGLAEALEQRLLGGARRYRRREVSGAAGVSLLSARKLWRALGFANVGDEVVAFTDADRDALGAVVGLVRRGLLDEETAIGLTRALGHTADRLVSWQTEALVEHLVRSRGLSEEGARREALVLLDSLVDDLERLLGYAWRRQMASAVGRLSAREPGPAAEALGSTLTVGFADLVSFTRLSQGLDEHGLAALVQRFEGLASDVVAAGRGRVVKTIGDEVLFVAETPTAGAAIGLDLAEHMAADDVLPDVRVGLARGPVLSRLGDVFGSTVNLASRLTAVAQPGTVLTEAGTATALADHHDIVLVPQAVRRVRGFGVVQPVLVARRAGARPAAGDAAG